MSMFGFVSKHEMLHWHDTMFLGPWILFLAARYLPRMMLKIKLRTDAISKSPEMPNEKDFRNSVIFRPLQYMSSSVKFP